MSSVDSVGTSPLVTSSDRLVGRVKWFNNKAGYGFITVSDGDRAGSDVFVHHSGVVVGNEQYKYLVQGEYVSFKLDHTPGGKHEYQAGEVSGINGGKLMCETRREFRQTRVSYGKSEEEEGEADPQTQVEEVRPPRSSRPPRAEGAPRARGSGPREGSEWTMVKEGRDKKPAQDRTVAGGRGRGRPPRSAAPKQD
jgi:CspA family cold shock protein